MPASAARPGRSSSRCLPAHTNQCQPNAARSSKPDSSGSRVRAAGSSLPCRSDTHPKRRTAGGALRCGRRSTGRPGTRACGEAGTDERSWPFPGGFAASRTTAIRWWSSYPPDGGDLRVRSGTKAFVLGNPAAEALLDGRRQLVGHGFLTPANAEVPRGVPGARPPRAERPRRLAGCG